MARRPGKTRKTPRRTAAPARRRSTAAPSTSAKRPTRRAAAKKRVAAGAKRTAKAAAKKRPVTRAAAKPVKKVVRTAKPVKPAAKKVVPVAARSGKATAVRKPIRKVTPKPTPKKQVVGARKVIRKVVTKTAAPPPPKVVAPSIPPPAPPVATPPTPTTTEKPRLGPKATARDVRRVPPVPRRTVVVPVIDLEPEDEDNDMLVPGPPSSLDVDHAPQRVREAEAKDAIGHKHRAGVDEAVVAGDPDADAHAAATTGDEAPGGENPTPGQDDVDLIGRSLGVEYDDDEELLGGAEIHERDRHRWELDPASSDDFRDRVKDQGIGNPKKTKA